jgi:hypothetical protein
MLALRADGPLQHHLPASCSLPVGPIADELIAAIGTVSPRLGHCLLPVSMFSSYAGQDVCRPQHPSVSPLLQSGLGTSLLTPREQQRMMEASEQRQALPRASPYAGLSGEESGAAHSCGGR